MSQQQQQQQQRSRRQFDGLPYPQIPIEESPSNNWGSLVFHDARTPQYLNSGRLLPPNTILDIGCGSGYTTLSLACANPSAQRIVGIDLSEVSVNAARERLAFHGFSNAEFYAMSAEDIEQLNIQFDYINCDETLYLLPDPLKGLQAMKACLSENGIIRANLHSLYERWHFYRAQNLFGVMGLMDDEADPEMAAEVVADTLKSLRSDTSLALTWREEIFMEGGQLNRSGIEMNYLFRNDKGFTVPQMFELLQQSDLHFINMLNWRDWDVRSQFEAGQMPWLWETALESMDKETALHVYELIHPTHRLLDFWAANKPSDRVPPVQWSEDEWAQATIHLHPQLCNDAVRDACRSNVAITLSAPPVIPQVQLPALLVGGILLPLLEGEQTLESLAARAEIEPNNAQLKQLLLGLEESMIVLLCQ